MDQSVTFRKRAYNTTPLKSLGVQGIKVKRSQICVSLSLHTTDSGRVATNLKIMEKLENSGNLKNCQNLRENAGKF